VKERETRVMELVGDVGSGKLEKGRDAHVGITLSTPVKDTFHAEERRVKQEKWKEGGPGKEDSSSSAEKEDARCHHAGKNSMVGGEERRGVGNRGGGSFNRDLDQNGNL